LSQKNVPFYFFNTAPIGFILLALTTEESSPSMPDVEGEEPFYEPTGPDSAEDPCVLTESMKALFFAIKYATPFVSGVVCNSVRELEGTALAALSKLPFNLQSNYYCVGPLIPAEAIITGSQLRQQDSIVKWLDSKEKNSVIYISFGSLSFPEAKQIQEIALALLALDKPFIWSIPRRQYASLPENLKKLSEENLEIVEKKSLLLPWAPQKFILQHPSTGVFVSHCGWNSTLEALFGGVPVVAWPMFSDQKMNAKWLVQKGVGLMLKGTGYNAQRVVANEEVSLVIREVAGWEKKEDGGQSYRISAETWRNVLQKCPEPEGSSHYDLMKFAASF
jgi:UDP-glucosyltransferase 85A